MAVARPSWPRRTSFQRFEGGWRLRVEAQSGALVALPFFLLMLGGAWVIYRGAWEAFGPPHLDALPWPVALFVSLLGVPFIWGSLVWATYYLGAGEQVEGSAEGVRVSLGWPPLGWSQRFQPGARLTLNLPSLSGPDGVRSTRFALAFRGEGSLFGRTYLGYRLPMQDGRRLLKLLKAQRPALNLKIQGD